MASLKHRDECNSDPYDMSEAEASDDDTEKQDGNDDEDSDIKEASVKFARPKSRTSRRWVWSLPAAARQQLIRRWQFQT